MAFLTQAGFLFGTVLFPILLMVGLGALVQTKHPLDVNTLSKLQIYLFVPVFLFVRVFDSTLSWGEIGGIALAVFLIKGGMAIPLFLFLKKQNVRRETLAVVLLSASLFNAGNFGIPVAERAFGASGGAVQALIAMVANMSLWGVGYAVMAASAGQGGWKKTVVGYFKLPMVYALVLAFIGKGFGITLPSPLAYAAHTLADGLIPLALVTLGVQLAQQARWPRWRAVFPVMVLKLVAMPVVATVVVFALHLWPWPGAMIIVASAGPTAVNTLLLTIEQRGDVELAADCVFWTTLGAAIATTLLLAIVTALGGGPPK